jgi:predicted branched-subunit amino acid permease
MTGRARFSALFGARPALADARREAFGAGLRAVLPALVATGTWGLVTGVAMVKVGLSQLEALGMTLLVFAGSAQLAALPLIAADAPVWVVLLTATVVNLRFVIFSAGLYPFFRRYSLGRRLLLGYVTSDVGFAISLQRWTAARSSTSSAHDERADPLAATRRVWFFLGIAAGNWLSWQTMSILGIFLAGQVPGAWGLEYAAILALIALTVPMVNGLPNVVGALVAGTVAVVGAGLPLKLGLVVAVIVGISAAMATELAQERLLRTGGGGRR